MARSTKGPRLYFDRIREKWIIRDGKQFHRLPVSSHEEATNILQDYLKKIAAREKGCKNGTIYVIGLNNYAKIGFTSIELSERIKYLKISMPENPIILGQFPGTTDDELTLHRRFSAYRANGEWFHVQGDLAAWIAAGCSHAICAKPVPIRRKKTVNARHKLLIMKENGVHILKRVISV